MSNDPYLKTGVTIDFSNDLVPKKGKYFSVTGWTGFYKGIIIADENIFTMKSSKYFAVWTGFYKGIKKVFSINRIK